MLCLHLYMNIDLIQDSWIISQELRKITYKIPSVDQLWQLKNELNLLGIMHYEWIEQPENITTCVAFGPLEMDDRIRGIFDKYQVKLY